MKKMAAVAVVLACTWSGFALSGPSAGNLDQSLLVGLSFGSPQTPELSLRYAVEQPPAIRHALARFGIGTLPVDPASTANIDRLWLPPLAQWDWRSSRGCGVRLNGVSLLSQGSPRRNADGSPAREAAAGSGMSLTTKLLIGGAAAAAIAVAAGAGGGGHGSGGGGNSSCATCNSDAAHQCDGVPSGVCSGNRLDDDGDCSTTCDTL